MGVFIKLLAKVGILLQVGMLVGMAAALTLFTNLSSARAATHGSKLTAQEQSQSPKRQLRAVWIATVVNIDWPSKPGLPVETQKQEFIHLLDEVQGMNMNAVVVQIKPTADAFYPSQYGPWSEYLTGVQGKDPGYNPLAFMIDEAHRRNIEFHAWFNPYRVSMQADPEKLSADHPARQHPDWLVSYGGKLYYNPGIPEARKFIEGSIMEVVNNYDIDAVHMDDYFYPYRVGNLDFPDEATYQQYGAATFANKADWRRDNVNQLIHELSLEIKQAKSYVKFGISPFGVWRNKATDPTGSDTTAGAQNYDDLYADTRTWIKNNWLDYIAPQIYWNIGFPPAAYDKLVDWWSKEVTGSNVQLYVGQAAYKINANNQAWANPEEMPNQLKLNLQYSQVKGSIFFSLKDLLRNPLGIKDRLTNDIYKQKALVPTMPWLDDKAPHGVILAIAKQRTEGVKLYWVDAPRDDSAYYAIYRFDGKGASSRDDFNDSRYLLTTVRKLDGHILQSFVDTTALAGQTYTYYVTALDRLHNESWPSNGRTITLK